MAPGIGSPSKESLDSKIYEIFTQHHNLDKTASAHRDSTQKSVTDVRGSKSMNVSQQLVKPKINTQKLTPGQKELMSIVKTIQLGKMPSLDRKVGLQTTSRQHTKRLFPGDIENPMTSIEGASSLEGSFDDGGSLHEQSIMKDAETGKPKVNPKFRKTQVKKIVKHFFN